jgi:signal transduction histidine kinase
MAADNGNLRIAVADDGAGFDAPAAARKSRGFGLFMIRERLKSLGGYCEIESALGAGSTVVLVAPLARAAPEEGGA